MRTGVAAIFQTGYIVSKRADGLWFLALPFLAVGIALACQQWLAAVALLSVGLWLTLPHHYATWIRTYTLNDEWQYYKPRLIIGPIVIAVMTFLGLKYAPLTLLLVVALWDHQHSVMQQHGFARIYDFKAKTGSPTTPKFDLALNWFLYVNLFLTAPFFTNFWVRELYRFHFPISRQAVFAIHSVSYCATGAFLLFYLIHLVSDIRQGYKVNPIKYLFVGSSFFLWYFTSWSTNDLLVYGIAHRIMHGLQYIVIIHLYLWNKAERAGGKVDGNFLAAILRPGSVVAFVVMSILYVLLFYFISRQPLEVLGFGVVSFTSAYNQPIREFGMTALTDTAGYTLFAGLMVHTPALLHYYVDSFIWRVRDKKVQAAL